jgi:hypothetical protein
LVANQPDVLVMSSHADESDKINEGNDIQMWLDGENKSLNTQFICNNILVK